MITATLFLPQLTLPHPSSVFISQLPNPKNTPKTTYPENNYHIYTPNVNFSNKTPPLTNTHLPNLQFFEENPQTNPSSSPLFDRSNFVSQLQSCSSLKEAKRLHTIAIKCWDGLDTYIYNNLISAYVKVRGLIEARKVFDEMLERTVVSWTAVLNGYLSAGLDDEAFSFLKEFVESGVRPNCKTFVCILNLCSRRLDYELGQQFHACIVKGNQNNLLVDSAIVHVYAECGDLLGATRTFDCMNEHDVVSWTTMITACSQHGQTEQAFLLFSRMISEGFCPNEFTICSVLKACGENGALMYGKQLHGTIVKKVFKNDVFIGTVLVDMYAKNKEILESRKVFDGMRKRNTVTWTSIIAGYARNGLPEEAITLFRTMRRRNISANNLTMVSILQACGSIRSLLLGKEIHTQLIKNHTQSNLYIGSTLVWLYCKCGEYSLASKILQKMPFKDVVSWTAMISGCAGLGHEYEALKFLKQMMWQGIEPNPFTYSSALKACAKLENINQGRLIHSSVNKTPAFSNVYVGSALVFMYLKCGSVSEAVEVFNNMPEKNLVSWKAMIVGYAKNGLCQEALKLMYRMQDEGVEVDDYIRATVLTACGGVELDTDFSEDHCLYPS